MKIFNSLLALWVATALCAYTTAPDRADLVVRDVTVYSGTGESPFVANVAVRDGRFLAIDRERSREFKAQRTIDGRNKYLSPGLWEMHAHVADDPDRGVMVADFVNYGVIALRNLGGHEGRIEELQTGISNGTIRGPTIYSAGPILNGKQLGSYHRAVISAGAARSAVKELVHGGAAQIKVHRSLSKPVFTAIIDTAHELGVTVTGHIPTGIHPLEACELGIDGIEHVRSLTDAYASTTTQDHANIASAIEYFESDDAEPIYDCLKRRGVFVTPTLIIYPVLARNRGQGAISPKRLEQINGLQRVTKRLFDRGVPLLVGTDTSSRESLKIVPGRSFHDELATLQDVGIPPIELISIASANAARALGIYTSHGTIEVGKFADFLLVKADPGTNIRNLKEIETVFQRGEPLQPARTK